MAGELGENLGGQDAIETSGREYFKKKVVVNTRECCCQEEKIKMFSVFTNFHVLSWNDTFCSVVGHKTF